MDSTNSEDGVADSEDDAIDASADAYAQYIDALDLLEGAIGPSALVPARIAINDYVERERSLATMG